MRQPTPFEQVLATNAALAEVNRSVTVAAIEAQKQNLISVELASKILNETDTIAILDKQITKLLAQGPEAAKANAATLEVFIDQIRLVAQNLVASGKLGIKNPDTQKAVGSEIQALYNLVDGLLDGLKAAGVIEKSGK